MHTGDFGDRSKPSVGTAEFTKAIVDRLEAECLRIVQMHDVVARFNGQGAEPSPLAAAPYTAFVKKEIEKWGRVVAATGMTAQ